MVSLYGAIMHGAAQLGGFVLFFYGITQGNNYSLWAGIAIVFGVMIDWKAWGKPFFGRKRNWGDNAFTSIMLEG